MSDDVFDDGHLAGTDFSVGPRIGFFEGLETGFEQQFKVDAFYSMESELRNRWIENLERAEEITGTPIQARTDLPAMGNLALAIRGLDPSIWEKNWVFEDGRIVETSGRVREQMIAANEQLKALNNPEIKSFEEMLDEVMELRREVEGRTAQASETASIGGSIGEFIGAIGGSFTVRDPLVLGTAPIGGFGRSVAARIATEAGIVGSVEAVQQFGKVEPTRAALGEPEGNPLFNTFVAAAGAGLLRGGIEGIVAGSRALGRRSAAKATPDIELDFEDAVLRDALASRPDLPEARAGAELLDEVVELEEASPYGTSPAGMKRFVAELNEAAEVMSGKVEGAEAGRPEVPFSRTLREADDELLKEEVPELFSSLEEAQVRAADLDDELADIDASINEYTENASSRLSEEDQIKLNRLERELEGDGPDFTRQREIIQEIEELSAKVVNDIPEILNGTRNEILDKQVKASKRIREIQDAIEAERTKLFEARQAAIRELEADAKDMLKQPALERPIAGSQTAHSYVREQGKVIEETAAKLDEQGEALVRSARGDNGIELGGQNIPEDFEIEIDGQRMTAREIMDDLDSDMDLEEAMRSCLL